MPYTKTDYIDGAAPAISAANLNKSETAIKLGADHSEVAHAPADADNTATNETSHADVLVDADIGVNVLSPTGNGSGLTGLTKATVGLGNVDNTSDADKPVSTATLAKIGSAVRFSGLVQHEGGIVSLNTVISKIDISNCNYWLSGIEYIYAGGTAITPTIEASDSSFFVGLGASGLIYQASSWTDIQKETIIPLCRLQTVQGQSGPGSDLQSPIDHRYIIGEEGFHKRLWHEQVIGALYHKGGEITNSTTPFQVDQNAGIFYTAQAVSKTVEASSNLEASVLKHVSGSWDLSTRATIVTPKFWDNGTDQVALGNNEWATHTLLKSPKEGDLFILVMSPAKYSSEADAQSAGIYYGLFLNAYISGLMPVAHLLIKGTGTDTIIEDHRPLIGENPGATLGTATMQQIYDNSQTPEITTDATRGALTIKEGTADDTALVYEGKNNAGTSTYSVDGNGLIFTSGLPTYADDTAAGIGGLTTGYLYQTATGELRIKL